MNPSPPVTRPVRLGAVSYLNTKPIVHGLDRAPEVSLRFDVPSACAALLASGEIDLGLVPSITYLHRAGDRIVPGVMIGSDGAVASVALFTKTPVRNIRRIALDTSSRTSAALTRVLCARRFEITPTFVDRAPDLNAMLASADAALVIGDIALFADAAAVGAEKIDLGSAWTEMTGLPFVWAFWSGPNTAAARSVVPRLQRACDEGVRASDALADAYGAGDAVRQAVARDYLRTNITYRLDDRALRGLATYYREAASLGLVDRAGPVEFFT